MEKNVFKNLRKFNLFMGLLHFLQGILMLALSNNFKLPINTYFLEFDSVANRLAPNTETIVELPIGPLVAVFLFISSLAHFWISSPGIFDWYKRNLKKGVNYARWIEYSLSSSLMIVIVSMLVGIYSLVSLLVIFFLNAAMIFFGWIMERHNQLTNKTDWTSFIFGSIVGLIPWLAIALYLFGSGGEGASPPDFVYWIFFSIFLFFNVFAINMVLQYKKVGPWKKYIYGEKAYIILSLVAKSALAWQVFFGTLRPM